MQKHLYFKTDQDQPISGWLDLPGTVREKGSGDGVKGGDEEGEEGAVDGGLGRFRLGKEICNSVQQILLKMQIL